MLKRLRPASPPPSAPFEAPSIPFNTEPRHDSKRRRLSLLAHTQRWDGTNITVENEEDTMSDNEFEEEEPRISTHGADSHGYKHANSILHELHILHQHRLLFSSAHPSNSSIHSQSTLEHLPAFGFDRSNTPSKVITTPHTVGQIGGPAFDLSALTSADLPPHTTQDESIYVTERYGDTNRLLGSLFLSRRKQLDAVGDASS